MSTTTVEQGQVFKPDSESTSGRKRRKGQMAVAGIRNLVPIAFALGIAVVVVTIMTKVTSEVEGNINDSDAESVANTGIGSLQDFVGWFDLVVLMAVTVVLLGALLVIQRFNLFGGGGGSA